MGGSSGSVNLTEISSFVPLSFHSPSFMVIWVVEFSREGYKIRNVFGQIEGIFFVWNDVVAVVENCQNLTTLDSGINKGLGLLIF